MHTTIYLHPKRTLVAQWDTDGEAPVISSYREYAPTADIRSDLRMDATVTVALHASATRWHHFPVDADDDALVRTAFEISTCLPDIDPTLDRIVAINERTRGTNRQWCALAAIPRTVVDDIAQRIGPEAHIVPDVQCDIHVALTCIAPQSHSWVLMGLRGEMWICAIISPEHTVESIVAFPVDPSISYTENAVECFYGIRSTSEHQVSHVLFFGDELTKSRYEEVASRLSDDSIIIGRLQPFRRVAASVDDATKRSLLALAHLVGPLVAPVLPSFEENESRENP